MAWPDLKHLPIHVPFLYLAGTFLSHGLSLLSWHSPPGILGVRARRPVYPGAEPRPGYVVLGK